jgi:hypothetical protein
MDKPNCQVSRILMDPRPIYVKRSENDSYYLFKIPEILKIFLKLKLKVLYSKGNEISFDAILIFDFFVNIHHTSNKNIKYHFLYSPLFCSLNSNSFFDGMSLLIAAFSFNIFISLSNNCLVFSAAVFVTFWKN